MPAVLLAPVTGTSIREVERRGTPGALALALPFAAIEEIPEYIKAIERVGTDDTEEFELETEEL